MQNSVSPSGLSTVGPSAKRDPHDQILLNYILVLSEEAVTATSRSI